MNSQKHAGYDLNTFHISDQLNFFVKTAFDYQKMPINDIKTICINKTISLFGVLGCLFGL